MSKKAAMYVRASTDLQKYSTSNQIVAIKDYAEEHKYFIEKIYEDDGFSGLRLEGRPALRQLLCDVLEPERKFEVLLVFDISRWGRFQDADESAYYEFLCKKAGVQVIYCAEHFIDDGPMGAVIKSIKRAMAAEYSRELSRKVDVGHRRLVVEGFSQGGTANIGLRRLLVDERRTPKKILRDGERKGLATDRVILVPGSPAEIDLVLRIFRMCAEEKLWPLQIAKILQKEGIPTKFGGRWASSTITAILKNEKYVGNHVYGRTTGQLQQRRVRAEKQTWTRCDQAFTPIIPAELFARVQERLKDRPRRRSDEEMMNDLKSLLEQKGYLDRDVINREPGICAAATYGYRFGGLLNAFRMVGFEPKRVNSFDRKRYYTRVYLLDKLEGCLRKFGQLSPSIMAKDPDVPSFQFYQREFGNIRAAYKLIGYSQERVGRPTAKRYIEKR